MSNGAAFGISDVLFYALALFTVFSASIVAFSQNLIYSAFSLLGTLLGVAGLYVFLAADYLAVIQVMIYIGGVLVIILFAVFMTEKIEAVNVSNRSLSLAAAIPVAGLLISTLVYFTLSTPWAKLEVLSANPITRKLGDAFLGRYLLPFEVASIVLLVAIIGAVLIARRQIRNKGGE